MAVAGRVGEAQAAQARGGGARQQDRADRVETHGERRKLSGGPSVLPAGGAGRLTRSTQARRACGEAGELQGTKRWLDRSIQRLDKSAASSGASATPSPCSDPICGTHL